MKNNLLATEKIPGFRKVVPKEVFLMKLRQKEERRTMLVVPDDPIHPNVDAVGHLYGVMCALSYDVIRVHQKILIATYFFPFFFYKNFMLLRTAPVCNEQHTPHLRIVGSS